MSEASRKMSEDELRALLAAVQSLSATSTHAVFDTPETQEGGA